MPPSDAHDESGAPGARSGRLAELARLFLKLGCVAFGGPAAHIAMLEDEVVARRGWLSRQHFLDLVGATHLIPGPNATEMALHVGYERAGWRGLLVAGASFTGPAVLAAGALAWLYVAYGALPAAEGLLYGARPAVLAVILVAVWRLGRRAVKDWRMALTGTAVAALVLGDAAGEIAALLVGGAVGGLWRHFTGRGNAGRGNAGRDNAGTGNTAARFLPILFLQDRLSRDRPSQNSLPQGAAAAQDSALQDSALQRAAPGSSSHAPPDGPVFRAAPGAEDAAAAAAGVAAAGGVSLWKLGLFFLKAGTVLYGSGYVLVAFLEGGLVEGYGWLTQAELLDAVALGQLTPGPVLSTATFVGFLLAGAGGALVATLGIFLPSFVFTSLLNPFVPRLRSGSAWLSAVLDAVNVSAIALMAAVTVELGAEVLTATWPAWVIAGLAAAGALLFRLNAAWLVLGGAALGGAFRILGWGF